MMRPARPARPQAGVPVPASALGPGRLPGDFLDELADELEASEQQARRHAERLAILSELQRAATATARRLGRPATVVDIIDAAGDASERDRLIALVNKLRA